MPGLVQQWVSCLKPRTLYGVSILPGPLCGALDCLLVAMARRPIVVQPRNLPYNSGSRRPMDHCAAVVWEAISQFVDAVAFQAETHRPYKSALRPFGFLELGHPIVGSHSGPLLTLRHDHDVTLTSAMEALLIFLFAWLAPPTQDTGPAVAPVSVQPTAAVAVMGTCDPVEGPRPKWSKEARMETRKRVRRACKATKASPALCAFADAVVVRESSGRAGVRHTLGAGENGLGAMGLNIASHRDKWPGQDEDPMFCVPEVSFAVVHAILWRAVTRYHASDWVDVQAIYSGRWQCNEGEDGVRRCFADSDERTARLICSRMAGRGHDCYEPILPKHLGRKIPFGQRREWALSLANRPLAE